ncbi:hypothetical protein BU24DRAFT_461609 [Aaosphaeria arxii CBS 175.79]|uniref:Golgi apparatus membrane protein TVP38 n=1 Tax=Aaosphaeria arxii CBS 175.79 TaxID=1450172 RepID=A0A6A5XR34_9PLEO|nr:uncharacterized protein BU24DRAFT_461609 [Aaosphaeria arxii CBS 175.79]KAF2015356.1 hypothetical protein BU24DRAFT_461609 [Aaosphaeria arxii CBS 175.79]
MADIEMGAMGAQKKKKDSSPENTEYRPVNWKRVFFAPKYIPWHLLFVGIGVATVMLTIHHDEVVEYLRPFSEKVRDLPAGWLIPIAILVILSFPPLFGHEVIALLCGVVYGLWIGFAIVAAGTFIGEIATWFAFKHALRRRAQKLERTNLNYGALARLTRDGGFWIVLLIRFSAIPSHFSTAVFSTCDVKFWHFVVSTFLSLPKQIFLVYLGVLLVQDKKDSLTQTIMFVSAFIITIVMAGWIWFKMKGIKKVLLDEQAQRNAQLQTKGGEKEADFERHDDTWSTVILRP